MVPAPEEGVIIKINGIIQLMSEFYLFFWFNLWQVIIQAPYKQEYDPFWW